jgi:hypothetical protein
MNRFFRLSMTFCLLFHTVEAYAWPPTFGAEFNFSNRTIMSAADGDYVNSKAALEAQHKMAETIGRSCIKNSCKITLTSNGYGVTVYRVTYEDGWWFQVATDPKVVEVQTKASTVEELKAHEKIIQDDIFGAAEQAGLQPASQLFGRAWAGGHFHVGISSSVGNDALFFRNVVVDNANHPELSAGIFANDVNNAPPIAALGEQNQRNFTFLIEEFDQKFSEKQAMPVAELAKAMNETVYFSTPSGWGPSEKYQAFNVTRVGNDHYEMSEQTFEIRGSRPQSSAAEYIAQVELTEKRLRMLRFVDKPIALHIRNLKGFPDLDRLTAFYDYVLETGLDFQNYEQFLTPRQNEALMQKIATRPALKPAHHSCERALEP